MRERGGRKGRRRRERKGGRREKRKGGGKEEKEGEEKGRRRGREGERRKGGGRFKHAMQYDVCRYRRSILVPTGCHGNQLHTQ